MYTYDTCGDRCIHIGICIHIGVYSLDDKSIYLRSIMGPACKEICLVPLFSNNGAFIHEVEQSKGFGRLGHKKHPSL
jgi:hypothetical protein